MPTEHPLSTLLPPTTNGREPESSLPVVSAYLNRFPDRIVSPLTGLSLPTSEALGARLSATAPGHSIGTLSPEDLARLVEGRFLTDDGTDASQQYRLAYASVETCSVCNHRCSFCPVSVDPRSMEVMPQETFVRIVDEILASSGPDLAIFLNNYNEPTVDPLFLSRLEVLFERKVRTALLTNGSRLTPEKIDRIREMGTLHYLGLNLPTVDPVRYEEMHGTDDFPKIRKNLEYLLSHPIAEQNAFVVLGYDDPRHEFDVEEIRRAYGESRWEIRKFRVQNRAGLVSAPLVPKPRRKLAGCELVGSRPIEHLHVVASGKAVFCCQDYYEHHVVGDLNRQSIPEVLGGEEMARLRRWTYGVEEAPEDFLCRNCEFALEA